MRLVLHFIKCLVWLYFLLITINSYSQSTGFEVNKSNDSIDIEPTRFIRNTNNGCIGITMETPIFDSFGIERSFINEIDELGNLNSKTFLKNDTIYAYYDIILIDDSISGYLLTGVGYDIHESPYYKFTVFTRLDLELNIIWEKIYTFDYMYVIWHSKVLQLQDGDYLYACSPRGTTDMFLFKLSSEGDSLAYKQYLGIEAGMVVDLTFNSDSTMYLLHTDGAHYSGNTSTCSVVTINEYLEQIDYDFYPDYYKTPYNSKLLPDGNILTGGSSRVTYPPGVDDKFIAAYRLDPTLNVIKEVLCTNPDTISRGAEIVAIDYYYPTCIYLAGNHNLQSITGNYPSWYFVTKLNEDLEIQYEKYIGGDNYYWLYSVVATNDGGVILAGTKTPVGAPAFHRDGYFIKLDSIGCVTNLHRNYKINIREAIIYPNPGNVRLTIRTALNNCTFYLFDKQGRCVLHRSINALITDINTTLIMSGIYTYIVKQDDIVKETGKWIKK